MKLYPFLLLLGVVLVASAAEEEQPCRDRRHPSSENPCEAQIRDGGCHRYWVRQDCRRSCDVCESYENEPPTGPVAVQYGGNHILTWDRLPFDNTAAGEFIFYRNARTGMKVHALSIRPEGLRTSVTTALSAIGSTGESRLQIGVDRIASIRSGADTAGLCKLIFWIGEEPLTGEQVEKVKNLGGYRGIAKIRAAVESNAYKLELRSGATVVISVQYGEHQGCYFDRIEVQLTEAQRANTTGLLGTPDNNIYNDWQRPTGSIVSLPSRKVNRYLLPAYNYARYHWCVRNVALSIIKYARLGTFKENRKCSRPYDGLLNFKSATEEMIDNCGELNYECLQDALSTNATIDGALTNKLREEVEIATGPKRVDLETRASSSDLSFLSNGLELRPRGTAAGKPWTVMVTLSLKQLVPGLIGFGLFVLNEENLSPTQKVVTFLTDDGDSGRGDVRRFDGIYTSVFSVELQNGQSVGYAAIPFIGGAYQPDRRDLRFVLPDAVRGYSEEYSGRSNLSAGNREVFLQSIARISVTVTFHWKEQDARAVAGVKFADEYSVGTGCGTSSKGRHIICDGCDKPVIGEFPEVKVNIFSALSARVFTATTAISLYGHRLEGRSSEAGPVIISVSVSKNRSDIFLLSMPVEPTTISESRCPVDDEASSHLGDLVLTNTRSDSWILELKKAKSD